jgi:hypothetical protein
VWKEIWKFLSLHSLFPSGEFIHFHTDNYTDNTSSEEKLYIADESTYQTSVFSVPITSSSDPTLRLVESRRIFFNLINESEKFEHYDDDDRGNKIKLLFSELLRFTREETWKKEMKPYVKLFYLFQIKRLLETHHCASSSMLETETERPLAKLISGNDKTKIFRSDFSVDDLMLATNYHFPKEVVEIILSNLNVSDESIFVKRLSTFIRQFND